MNYNSIYKMLIVQINTLENLRKNTLLTKIVFLNHNMKTYATGKILIQINMICLNVFKISKISKLSIVMEFLV